MASGALCRTNRSDTWPHQPALQRRPKTLAKGEPSTQGRLRPVPGPTIGEVPFGWTPSDRRALGNVTVAPGPCVDLGITLE